MGTRQLIFVVFLVAAACAENPSSLAQPAQTSGAPIPSGPPNTDFRPAFAGQTRAPAQSSGVALNIESVARLAHPWAIVFLPDGRALVTEQAGRLRIVTREGAVSPPIEGVPAVDARGQGGLFDVVLSPSFAADRVIYWSYAEERGQGRNSTSVARGRLSEDAARLTDVRVIFRQDPWRSQGHYGSRLVFDRDGNLFVTLGDRQGADSRPLAQDLSTTIGKIVRVTTDGAAAAGNPFAGRRDARAEIWSYGHRNVQGADLHPQTGELWTIEHGPRGGDEINLVRAGRNYGWPVITYGEDYSGEPISNASAREGMEQPLYYWDPVIAPGDMDFYRGELFPWRGDILVAGLATQVLARLRVEGERVVGEEWFNLGQGRVRDMAEAADGALWVITDEENGAVLRLTPR